MTEESEWAEIAYDTCHDAGHHVYNNYHTFIECPEEDL